VTRGKRGKKKRNGTERERGREGERERGRSRPGAKLKSALVAIPFFLEAEEGTLPGGNAIGQGSPPLPSLFPTSDTTDGMAETGGWLPPRERAGERARGLAPG
jgi:hypothetical protein